MSKPSKYFLITWVVCFIIILNYSLYIIDRSYIYLFVISILAPIVPSLIVFIVTAYLIKNNKKEKDPML